MRTVFVCVLTLRCLVPMAAAADAAEVAGMSVPFFSQRNTAWSSHRMGTSTCTIGSCGCAMTCTAMLAKFYGKDTDPGQMNSWLSSNGGYMATGDIDWGKAAEYTSGRMSYERGLSWTSLSIGTDNDRWSSLRSQLDAGYPVIVWVDPDLSTPELEKHWVLVTGFTGGDMTKPANYRINDPSSDHGGESLYKYYDAIYDNTFFATRVYHGQQDVVETPHISGVDPSSPTAQASRQWISILGSNFRSDSVVTLSIQGYDYVIPSDRTQYQNSGQTDVYVGLTDPGTWYAQVTNPGDRVSNSYPFTVSSSSVTLTPEEVAAYAYDAGFRGGSLILAVAVAGAESSYDVGAVNFNWNDTVDRGLWQINSIHGYDPASLLTDPSYNAEAAFNIWTNAGESWTPWVAFNNGAYQGFLGQARPAAASVDSTVIKTVGDRVRVAAGLLNVRSSPGGAYLAHKQTGDSGTTIDGPVVTPLQNGTYDYIWWQIRWDDGVTTGWSVENLLVQDSAPPADTTPPTIISFTVTPRVEGSFTISYTVSDSGGSGLKQVELWRANIDGTVSDSSWANLQTDSLSGDGPVSGAFVNSPTIAGTYWYGIHVADNAGNPVDERQAGLGPIKVTLSPPSLSVSPSSRDVGSGSGSTTFSVSNTGGSTMSYSAGVIAGSSWLSITSGGSGGNSGTIRASFTANTGGTTRTGTIRVTAPGAQGSPRDVTVTQPPSAPGYHTGWASPTAHNVARDIPGTIEWNNPANAYTRDGQYATGGDGLQIQAYSGFRFDFPSGAVITGIEVRLEGKVDTWSMGVCWDPKFQICLSKDGRQWGPPKFTGRLTASISTLTVGGGLGTDSDMWYRRWITLDFGADFAVEVYPTCFTTPPTTYYLDYVQARVHFRWPPIPGDANGDCKVNILDLMFIRNRLNQDVGTADNWQADVNGDGKINIVDLIAARNKLNTKCPE